MGTNCCLWFLGILVIVLLGCCCCMGRQLGKLYKKCGRCIYFDCKDKKCEEEKKSE